MDIGFRNVEATAAAIRREHACYVCGEVPTLYDATTFGDREPVYVAGAWPTPALDHEHANTPPTPEQLEDAGHAALRRILEA